MIANDALNQGALQKVRKSIIVSYVIWLAPASLVSQF